jgi:2-oxoglutarate ferredoxin oxidoreductase subunit delta
MAQYSVKIIKERCKGCHLCIHFCRNGILRPADEVNEHGYYAAEAVKPDECKGCSFCYLICPDMAVEISKEDEQA